MVLIWLILKNIKSIIKRKSRAIWLLYGSFFCGFTKMWNYNRYHDVPKIENLYTGINIERSKNHGLIDGIKCLFKKGDIIVFPSFGSTTSKYSIAEGFAKIQEEALFSI